MSEACHGDAPAERVRQEGTRKKRKDPVLPFWGRADARRSCCPGFSLLKTGESLYIFSKVKES